MVKCDIPEIEILPSYSIDGGHIYENGVRRTTNNGIYLREVIDLYSHEFKTSKISNKKRLELIMFFGFDKMAAELKKIFDKKGVREETRLTVLLAFQYLMEAVYPAVEVKLNCDDSEGLPYPRLWLELPIS